MQGASGERRRRAASRAMTSRIVGGDRHVRLGLQRAEARHLLLADQVVADQDVVDAGFGHHLGLAELLAGDALGAGRDLQLREQRALVRLDMRPVGDAGGVAGRLDARDVALDPVHVDDEGRACRIRGRSWRRGGGHYANSGISTRHCEGEGEAIQLLRGLEMDCFASLAMTTDRLRVLDFFAEHLQLQPSLFGRLRSSCAFDSAADAVSNFLRSFL